MLKDRIANLDELSENAEADYAAIAADEDRVTAEITELMQKLAEEGQLMSYIHKGFWQCMDTAREKQVLEKMLATGNAPWKKWED